MHHHRLDARLLEQNDVLGEILLRGGIAHGVAAILDHDHLLIIALHMRQRLGQDLGLDMDVGQIGHGFPFALGRL